jgi:hypothetical protein
MTTKKTKSTVELPQRWGIWCPARPGGWLKTEDKIVFFASREDAEKHATELRSESPATSYETTLYVQTEEDEEPEEINLGWHIDPDLYLSFATRVDPDYGGTYVVWTLAYGFDSIIKISAADAAALLTRKPDSTY